MTYEAYLKNTYTDKDVKELGLMAGKNIKQILNQRKKYIQNSYHLNLPHNNIYILKFFI